MMSDKNLSEKYYSETEYPFGVEWIEFNKEDRMVRKDKFFKTSKAMDKFIEKLEQKNNFYKISGYAF